MILPAQHISARCDLSGGRPMITPYHERSRIHGMTYGVSPAGYDIRIKEDFTLQPKEFTLASSIEYFDMPMDLIAFVHDKSSWARFGLTVKNTVIEPNWRGYLTLELTNDHHKDVLQIKSGSPIAQIVFHLLLEPTKLPYNGKYQDQAAGAVHTILES